MESSASLNGSNEDSYNKFNKYNALLANLRMYEKVEEGCLLDQAKYFIDYLVSKPQIKIVLEIGFNTGLSAAAFLASRDDVLVMSVDIGYHTYISSCKKIVDSQFPKRHTLVIGDSKAIIPRLGALKPDLIFIDGDHIEPVPLIDARNCLAIAHKDTVLIMDDTTLVNGWAGILEGMCELIKKGEIDTSRIITIGSSANAWTLFWKPPQLP